MTDVDGIPRGKCGLAWLCVALVESKVDWSDRVVLSCVELGSYSWFMGLYELGLS